MDPSSPSSTHPSPPTPRTLLVAALEAAGTCGRFLREEFLRPVGTYEEKAPGDLVSEIDRESQRLARDTLLGHTPGALFLGEEETGEEPYWEPDPGPRPQIGEGLCWIVDPLDGTTNFLHRFPVFAVSVAVARGQRLLAAVVYNPISDECFAAAAGEGATLNGLPLHVSEETRLERSLLATGWPFRRKELLKAYLKVLDEVFRGSQGLRRAGAASLDLAWTAAGRLEGFWEFGLKIWDVAAGALIVQEAGGKVTDFSGSAGWWESGDIVASNGHIHTDLLGLAATPEGLRELERR
jgi:myo-inositol-1(or 4)-monophosphatase